MILITELNRTISAVEDRIPRWLQYYHKTCCEKDGCYGRQTCIIQRWYYCGDVISRWVGLHMIITTYMTRNCLLSLKLSRFGDTIWKIQPIPSTLLWIIKTLSISLLPRCWLGGKHSGSSIFLSSTLSSGSVLVVLAQNQILSPDNGTSILKRGILATPQSTLTTSSRSSLKNNL